MIYNASRSFQGDLEKALDLAIAALSAVGFRLDERTADSVRLTGPGMSSNRQSPLVGASQLDIRLRQGQLDVAADLGAAERMIRFARIFPIALNGGLALVFLAVFGTIFAGRVAPLFWLIPVIAVTLLNGAVWAVLSPWIARSIHQRTCRGLDALLSTMVVTGQQSAKADLATAHTSFSAK
jgi:hypothetical protein